MINIKHEWKLSRAWRSFEYAGRDLAAARFSDEPDEAKRETESAAFLGHLLDRVTADDVESIVFLEQRQRYAAAYAVLQRLAAESKP